MMAPLALWLLRHGVAFSAFADALKPIFVAAARDELERSGVKPSQSALSMLSGVHRKDVREIGASARPATAPARPPLTAQVFERWLTDRRYRGANGTPRALARSGEGRSFDALCRELSQDVHARTVLDDLLRLGLVAIDGDKVVPQAAGLMPTQELAKTSEIFSANVADHIAAAVRNLTLAEPKLLEQSLYVDGLTETSVEELQAAACKAWSRAVETIGVEARDRLDRDKGRGGRQRMRFGTYFFAEPVAAPHAAAGASREDPSLSASSRRRTRIKP